MKSHSAFVLLVWVVAAIGWCMNIFFIIDSVAGNSLGDIQVTALLIFRVVGVFFGPLGAILGYIPS